MSACCMGVAVLVAFIDYELGVEVSLIAAYVLPVSAAAWYGPRCAGYVTAGAAAGGLFAADRLGGTMYSLEVLAYWDSIVNGTTLAVVAALVVAVRDRLRREHRIARTDCETGVFTSRHLRQAAIAEAHRAYEFQQPFALIQLRLNLSGLTRPARVRELRRLASHVRTGLRPVDCIGLCGHTGLAVLMPGADLGAAAERLGTLLRDAAPTTPTAPPIAGIIVFALEDQDTGLEDIAELVDRALACADRDMEDTGNPGAGCVFIHEWQRGQLHALPPWTPLGNRARPTPAATDLGGRLLTLAH